MFFKKSSAGTNTAPPPPADKPHLSQTPPPPPPLLTPQSASKAKQWPAKGSYVYAKILDWEEYYGGQVVKADGDTFEILFDDGERHAGVKRSEIIKSLDQVSAIRDATAPSVLHHRFRVGDKVSCKISGWSTYYDGVVTSLHSQGYSVDFADGDKISIVREKEMIPNMAEEDMQRVVPLPDYIKLKCRVEAKFTGWNKYYAGVIKDIAPNRATCTVQFEDGETKTGITADMVRMSKSKSVHHITFIDEGDEDDDDEEAAAAAQHKFPVNTRVLANPHGTWSKAFPGRVELLRRDGTYGILFDDGERTAGVEERDLTLENTKLKQNQGPSMEREDEQDFRVGQDVEAKVGQWRKHYPGTVTRISHNALKHSPSTYTVEFVDGEVVEGVKRAEMRLPRLRPDAEGGGDSVPSSPTAGAADVVYQAGERVAAKIKGWKNFWGGYVVQVNAQDKTYKVEFDDGEMYYVFPEDMMRPAPGSALYTPVLKPVNAVAKPIQQQPQPAPAVVATTSGGVVYEVGERVECKLADWTRYYPGLVEKRHEHDGTYAIHFDDMERVISVKASEMRRVPTVRNSRYSIDDDDDASDNDDEVGFRPVI